ncbi:hypothetical protein LTR10_022244 [Elasticomyces elasticus]|uniref:Extracellular membrane protein CFEM domain-containing protein n=1 Tax=Exophiala sideris TaxID=1016849 RepID=A0ABR0JTU2_9EURO|nr:hypothetical protein LTR10_022244 [Elasticomyces elasticus]KAK5040456.1 hypothetical protein LTS07_000954 [Exophiala sideris]KAK5043118.1 hypothetical protein LTR13_000889 [Exophiala sideris]KAK5068834.1 hypothetical protein LTR69_000955 [Exophiala sideris]KAK5186431.1 hypothetical protein LTR44_001487 [Eurotiomycetes sp. CCFEE 6388]
MTPFLATLLASAALILRTVTSQSTSIDYCEALVDVLSICEAETPSFTLLAQTAQAPCLCGSQLGTISWGPSSWDNLASACAVQYATVNVAVASDASVLDTFCTGYAANGQSVVASQTTRASTGPSASVTPSATAQTSARESSATNTGLYSIASSVTPSAGSGTTANPSTVVSVVTASPSLTSATKTGAAPRSAPGNVDFLSVLLTFGAMAAAELFIAM